jgi:WD40 repeat protein
MGDGRLFRQLLVADLALLRGAAPARDVAAALQRWWDVRGAPGADLAAELVRIAGLAPGALDAVVAEAEEMLRAAGGDERLALTRLGGIDRALHAEIGASCVPLFREIAEGDLPVALAPLRAGRYVDFEVVGEGGMGVVYLALDTELNRRVAFKIVRPGAAGGPADTPTSPVLASPPAEGTPASRAFEELRTRFLQEAWITSGMEHPGVIPVYELGQTPAGVPYYTMRFVKGRRTLADALDAARSAPFAERARLLEPFLKLCDTVHYAHARGVVHRDLKPANVALGEFGEVVVLDWGLAKVEGRADAAVSLWRERVDDLRTAQDLATAAAAIGTPGYMAPEAALGKTTRIDARSDVYSLSAVLYRILTGRLPFEVDTYGLYVARITSEAPPTPRVLDPEVPEALSALCLAGLERDPARRPATAGDVASAVRAWQAESAREREVHLRVGEARAAIAAAEASGGEARLASVDLATAALARARELAPDLPEARDIGDRAAALRRTGIDEASRGARRRLLARLAAGALVLGAAAGFVVAGLLAERRREAELAREDEATARRAAEAAEADARRAMDELLFEHGRVQHTFGDPVRSLAYAREVLRRGRDDDALRYLVTHALRQVEPEIRAVAGHGAAIPCVRASPDGRRIVTASRDRTAKVWDAATGALLFALADSDDYVWAVTFRPGDDAFLVTGFDATARLYALEDGRLLRAFAGHPGPVEAAAFSPDGLTLVTVGREGGARVYDAETGALRHALAGHEGIVRAVDVSPDGSRAVTGGDGGTLRVFDLATGTESLAIRVAETQIPCVAFVDAGRRIAAGDARGALTLWSAEDGSRLGGWNVRGGRADTLVLSPDGRTLAIGGSTDGFDRFDVATAARVTTYGFSGGTVQEIAFSPDGSRLASAHADGTVQVWNTEGGFRIATLGGRGRAVESVAFAPDGAWIASADAGGTWRQWRVPLRDTLPTFRAHERAVRGIAVDAEKGRFATWGYDAFVRVWADPSGERLAELSLATAEPRGARFVPGSDALLVLEHDGTLAAWEVASGRREAWVKREESGGYRAMALSPDGTRLLTGGLGGAVDLHTVPPTTPERRLEVGDEEVWAVAMDPALRRAAAGTYDGHVRVWDLGTGAVLHDLHVHDEIALALAFSDDGRRL